MRHFSSVVALNPILYARALFNPYVALGVGALVLGLLTRMALLSMADLSIVLPLTASGYVVSTILGKLILREEVTAYRWLGTLLIFAGAVIVGFREKQSSTGETELLLTGE